MGLLDFRQVSPHPVLLAYTIPLLLLYANLPLLGQASQDLAISMAPIRKSSAAQICQASPRPPPKGREIPSRTSTTVLTGTMATRTRATVMTGTRATWTITTVLNRQLPSVVCHQCFPALIPMLLPSIASRDCSPVWFPSFASQSGIEVLLLNLASHGWDRLTQIIGCSAFF